MPARQPTSTCCSLGGAWQSLDGCRLRCPPEPSDRAFAPLLSTKSTFNTPACRARPLKTDALADAGFDVLLDQTRNGSKIPNEAPCQQRADRRTLLPQKQIKSNSNSFHGQHPPHGECPHLPSRENELCAHTGKPTCIHAHPAISEKSLLLAP